MSFFKTVSLLFSAGAVGGLANALVVGFYTVLTNPTTPGLSKEIIYSRVIWGGLWGVLFVFFMKARNLYTRGLVLSLAPTLIQLLVVFPVKHQGLFGTSLGEFTFIRVLLFNAVWGLAAAFWLKRVKAE